MNKHSTANKYLPIALALAAFTAAGTAPALAQQSGWGAGISTRNAQPYVHQQSINHSGSSVGRADPFGVDE
jgi:hypothetical protein